jgi:hypothetical protein
MCVPASTPNISVNLPGAPKVSVPAVQTAPQLPGTPPDFFQPGQKVSIIGVLRDKTRGNLTHDEDTLLDAILFDLRMKYVEKARQTNR